MPAKPSLPGFLQGMAVTARTAKEIHDLVESLRR